MRNKDEYVQPVPAPKKSTGKNFLKSVKSKASFMFSRSATRTSPDEHSDTEELPISTENIDSVIKANMAPFTLNPLLSRDAQLVSYFDTIGAVRFTNDHF